jgi:hypothetical protein
MQTERDAFLAEVAAWSSAEVWLEASNLIAWLRVTCETKQPCRAREDDCRKLARAAGAVQR